MSAKIESNVNGINEQMCMLITSPYYSQNCSLKSSSAKKVLLLSREHN